MGEAHVLLIYVQDAPVGVCVHVAEGVTNLVYDLGMTYLKYDLSW